MKIAENVDDKLENGFPSMKTGKNVDGSPNLWPHAARLPLVPVPDLLVSYRLAQFPAISVSGPLILCRAWYVKTSVWTGLERKNIFERVLQMSVNQEYNSYACLPGHACIWAKMLTLRDLQNTHAALRQYSPLF